MNYTNKQKKIIRRSLREDNNVFVWDGTSKVPEDVEHVRIADGVTKIKSKAFEDRTSMKTVSIPNSVNSIGNAAFSGCVKLQNITIPNSVRTIGNDAFEGCWPLTTIKIPESVRKIGLRAFLNCANVTNITILSPNVDIDDCAFWGCPLTDVTVCNGVELKYAISQWRLPEVNIHIIGGESPDYSVENGIEDEDEGDDTDSTEDLEARGDDFYRRAEKELEKHFNCTGAYLEPSTQAGVGGVFLFADDMTFDGSFDFQTGEDYIYEDDFEGFLRLCMNSFKSSANESYTYRDIFEALNRAHEMDEAAFSGGYAEGGNVIDRHARPGASVQPDKKSYLGRLKNKNPDLVDIITVKGKDIKRGMITQSGQVKDAEVKKNNRGETKVYIMHTNNYDGFWDVNQDMEVLADPENRSKPFTGDYRSLLKMGLKESADRDAEKKLKNAAESVKCKLTRGFKGYTRRSQIR